MNIDEYVDTLHREAEAFRGWYKMRSKNNGNKAPFRKNESQALFDAHYFFWSFSPEMSSGLLENDELRERLGV